MLLHVWSLDFMAPHYLLNKSRVNMINIYVLHFAGYEYFGCDSMNNKPHRKLPGKWPVKRKFDFSL